MSSPSGRSYIFVDMYVPANMSPIHMCHKLTKFSLKIGLNFFPGVSTIQGSLRLPWNWVFPSWEYTPFSGYLHAARCPQQMSHPPRHLPTGIYGPRRSLPVSGAEVPTEAATSGEKIQQWNVSGGEGAGRACRVQKGTMWKWSPFLDRCFVA